MNSKYKLAVLLSLAVFLAVGCNKTNPGNSSVTVQKQTSQPQNQSIQALSPQAPAPAPTPAVIPTASSKSTAQTNSPAGGSSPTSTPALPPATPPPAAPAPVVTPPPQPTIDTFNISADDQGASMGSLAVKKGDTVKITFNVKPTGVYYGGLDFRSSVINTGTIFSGQSKTISFIGESSFSFTPYWPASNIAKSYTINVQVTQ